MKKLILFLMLSVLSVGTNAQELMIKSLELDLTDLTARSKVREDFNGDACALLKVNVVDDIANVNGGVVGDIEKNGSEAMIYLEEGTKILKIVPKNHLPVDVIFADYGINSVEGKNTYILYLVEDKSGTSHSNIEYDNIVKAEQYCEEAMKYLHNLNDVSTNYSKAINLYNKAIALNYPRGYLGLGSIYHSGTGVDKDLEKAKELYNTAAEMGSVAALYNLGQLYYESNPAKSFEYFLQGAEKGLAQAQLNVGYRYQHGYGCPTNYKKAMEWYTKASNQGNTLADVNIGVMYQLGLGVKKDEKKACSIYKAAAENGSKEGQYDYAKCLIEGIGTKKNKTQAIEWLKKSSDQGFDMADSYLAKLYFDGDGVKKDTNEAVRLLTKSANSGNPKSQSELALRYAYGNGIPQDLNQASYWLNKAIEQKSSDGYLAQGNLYLDGVLYNKDPKKAYECYKKASEIDPNYSSPIYAIGFCYYNGYGVSKDEGTAIKYFEKAANLGDPAAKSVLKKLKPSFGSSLMQSLLNSVSVSTK